MQAKGMRRAVLTDGKVHVFSDTNRIILQVRANGPENDPLVTWAKAAARLSRTDALQLASELLRAAVELDSTITKPVPPKAKNGNAVQGSGKKAPLP
jgi:hypothetical protein